jgi:hypothetical protein
VITGDSEAEVEAMRGLVRSQISFYGSTPAYRGALEIHGRGDLQTELNSLSKQGRWAEMAKLVDEDVLDIFAVEGTPDEIPGVLLARYGDLADRMSFYTFAGGAGSTTWARIVAGLRRGAAPSPT